LVLLNNIAKNNNDNKSTLISLQIKEYVLLLRENSKTCKNKSVYILIINNLVILNGSKN